MEVSPQAFEFANLVLNHYDIKKKQTSKTEEEPIENPNNPNPIPDIKTKYSMDYKKFEALSKETEIKPSQAEDPFKTNPYLAQMGCSHDRRKERELYEKTTKEKLDDAEFFKTEGNKAYKQGEYQKASYFYQKGLLQFDYTFTDTDDEEKRMNNLKESCHCNLALVKYLLKDSDESLTQCFQALKINPKNVKAMFRKAIIHFERDLFEETQKIINEILNLDPNEKETLKLQENLRKKEADYKIKAKLVTKKMFEN